MTSALSITSLTKIYGEGHKAFQALKNVDLNVEQGDFFALLGSNGAGKSTIISIVSSLVGKTSGTVKVFDVDIDQNFSLAKSYIGIVPQEINFSVFETPEQIVMNQAGYYGIPRKLARQRMDYLLEKLGLSDKKNNTTQRLSGGMKRRLMIARALVNKPRLLILDEPTAGVDVEIRRSMWEFLSEVNVNGTTIILTTHYLEEAESLCRNVAIINQGKVIENTSTKALLAKLHYETYILDLVESLDRIPQTLLNLSGYQWKLVNDVTLEVKLKKEYGISFIFESLAKCNIGIQSMRNKSNRLEQLFVQMTNGRSQGCYQGNEQFNVKPA